MNKTPEMPKYRHELKYQINPAFSVVLRQRLQSVMLRDPHSNAAGSYTVTSLYFDNCFDKALKEKRYGLNRREKFRLRYYDTFSGNVSLEKKQKHNGLCLKSSTIISPSLCRRILDCDYLYLTAEDNPLVQELGIKMQTQLLRPKFAVRYQREAFIYGPGNIRVTLGTKLLACTATPYLYILAIPHISRLSAISFTVLFMPPPAAVAMTTACFLHISALGL